VAAGQREHIKLTKPPSAIIGSEDDTTGKSMIAVRSNLYRAHIFGPTVKRSFAVRIFHGARQKKNAQ
jgi:hypothetical protein